MAKEPVCMCGHLKSFHCFKGQSSEDPKCTRCDAFLCTCKSFTDKRISVRRAASKSTREAGPKAEIINLLEAKGIRPFRMQSGSSHVARGNHITLNKKGTPDIVFWYPWHRTDNPPKLFFIVWCEVKKTDGKPSKEQVAFKEQAEALGETYLLARSAGDVEKWLKENL